jgi:MSHA biogenesis protein MshQ
VAFVSSDKGIKTSADFTLTSAYANLVAVMSEGGVTACSVDSFSVRPTKFSSVSSSATNATLTGTPKFKAGTDSFSLTVTANAGGYSGTPKINPTAMSATGSGWTVGSLTPAVFPAATAGASTSVATSSNFTYSEVGNFRFLGFDPASNTASSRGIYDDDWVAVDSASTKNDCVANSYANTKDASGKYGCLFGLFDSGASAPNSALFGRFVPDHFAYVGGGLTPFCSSGGSPFTYMGQPALGVAYRLQARNGANAVTTNYSQALGYPVSNPVLVAEDQAGTNQGCDLVSRIGSLPTAQWTAGMYTLNDAAGDNVPDTATAVFTRPTTPVALTAATCAANTASAGGPFFLLDIGVSISDLDAGAVLSEAASLPALDMNPATAGVCSGTACNARRIGSTAVVYGRLWLNNAYGSEMLPLAVPVLAQYWTAAGWQKNTFDSCTAITQPTRQDSGNGGLLFYAPPDTTRNALAPGEVIAQMGGSTASSVVLLKGDARLVLRGSSALVGPGSGNYGYLDVIGSKLTSATWLPPTGNARACFGACGPRSPIIYLRESY